MVENKTKKGKELSLHAGLDTMAIASFGNFSTTYGVGEEGNTANLVVSFGFLEDAPGPLESTGNRLLEWFWEFF